MDRHFLTFEKARELLKNSVFVLGSTEIPIENAVGYILAENVYSPFDLPSWTNSAMDGYAVKESKVKTHPHFSGREFRIVGEIRAGEYKNIILKDGEAVRVFTGSIIPDNADAVVMQENCALTPFGVRIMKSIKKGENIRYKGEEIKKGKRVLKRGTILTPAGIGLLSAMGIQRIKVIRKPKVYLIVTGSEIIEPGEKLKPGKIYDANSFSVLSALKTIGIENIKIKRLSDDFGKIKKCFYSALDFADVILFSGGISVGDFDYVRDLFEKEKVKKIFYRVAQKPGKPIFLGKKSKKIIFGLPGNPASVLICFYEYVYPVIRKMSGFKEIFLHQIKIKLLREIKKKTDKTYFLKGKIYKNGVYPLDYQESHMLSSFAIADCLILAPEKRKTIRKGEKVIVHLLP